VSRNAPSISKDLAAELSIELDKELISDKYAKAKALTEELELMSSMFTIL